MTIGQLKAARRKTRNDKRWKKVDAAKSARKEAVKVARANAAKKKAK